MRAHRLAPHRCERGASLVELAIVLPMLAIITFGMLEFGSNLNDLQSLRQGLRDAAREVAASEPGTFPTEASLRDFVARRVDLDSTRLSVSWTPRDTTGAAGSNFRICGRYRVRAITGIIDPFLPDTLRSDVTMRFEKDVNVPNSSSTVSPCP